MAIIAVLDGALTPGKMDEDEKRPWKRHGEREVLLKENDTGVSQADQPSLDESQKELFGENSDDVNYAADVESGSGSSKFESSRPSERTTDDEEGGGTVTDEREGEVKINKVTATDYCYGRNWGVKQRSAAERRGFQGNY